MKGSRRKKGEKASDQEAKTTEKADQAKGKRSLHKDKSEVDKSPSSNKQCYKELKQRMQRYKQLSTVALKMKTQKELMVRLHVVM